MPAATRYRINRLDPVIVAWILGRARQFSNGKPMWHYPEIARNLRRSRGVELSTWAVKRVVTREDPELERRRATASRKQPAFRPSASSRAMP